MVLRFRIQLAITPAGSTSFFCFAMSVMQIQSIQSFVIVLIFTSFTVIKFCLAILLFISCCKDTTFLLNRKEFQQKTSSKQIPFYHPILVGETDGGSGILRGFGLVGSLLVCWRRALACYAFRHQQKRGQELVDQSFHQLNGLMFAREH